MGWQDDRRWKNDPNDYRWAERAFARDLTSIELKSAPPHGTFGQSRNFMTPNVLGYVNVLGVPVEISTGTGFYGDRIYGVSWPNGLHGHSEAACQCCHSWEEVLHTLGVTR